jgi:hypothetical protein
MNKKNKIILSLFSLFGLLFALGGIYILAQSGWQEPTATPPGDNVSAPINVGPETQTKQGGLNILGKLGIGKENPEVEVDVEGEIRATERICVKNPVTGSEVCLGPFTQLPVSDTHPVVCGQDFEGQNEGMIYFNNKDRIELGQPGKICVCLGVQTSEFPDGWSCEAAPAEFEPTSKIVFVTSTTYLGNLGGLAGANAKCQERAEAGCAAGVNQLCGKTFRAWVSADPPFPNAKENIQCAEHKSYMTVAGAPIAASCSDLLDGELINPIGKTEFLGYHYWRPVWTGSYPDGTAVENNTCRSWTVSGGALGMTGNSSRADTGWTYQPSDGKLCGGEPPSFYLPIYCFEI